MSTETGPVIGGRTGQACGTPGPGAELRPGGASGPRRSPRTRPRNGVVVTVEESSDAQLLGTVQNVSTGGFCGHLHGPRLAAAAEVGARLSLVGRRGSLNARARVAWMRPSDKSQGTEYGFAWLEGGELNELLELLRTRA